LLLLSAAQAERFNSLEDSQRSTLLDLIFGADFIKDKAETYDEWDNNLLPRVCEWLSIVQKRWDLAIYEDVGYSKWQISRIIFLWL
jgi:hypothetical protein